MRFPRLTVVLACLLPAVVAEAAESDSARLVNVATRVPVGGAAGTPIHGFVLRGSGSKPIVMRAVGPTLSRFGVPDVLPDPRLTVLAGDRTIAANDNWPVNDATAMFNAGAFALPPDSRDAAVVAPLGAGSYTAPVTAADGGTGVALVEVYDGAPGSGPVIVNASTRAFVGADDSVLIPGFVISGSGTLRLLIRAIGPSLAQFGVTGTLADPTITLFSGQTAIATNDNWSSAANAAEIAAAGTGAFPLATGSRDAALLLTLGPGSYSAVVSGVGETTGTALVELYVISPSSAPVPAGLSPLDVTASPSSPSYTDKVFITARGQPDPGGSVAQLRVTYAAGGAAPITVVMADDGLHGDAVAGDGIFGGVIPAQPIGAVLTYSVTASDPAGKAVSSPPISYTVGAALGDATFTSPEFLGIPTERSATLNLEARDTLEMYAELGAASGAYTIATPMATYPAGSPAEFVLQAPPSQPPLQSNRRYYYRVRYRAPGEATFRARGERSFQTQRPRGQPFTFTVTADPHFDEVTSQPLLTLAMRNIAADNPDFNVDLGDILMSDKLATILPGLRINYGLVEYRAVALRNNFAEFAHSVPFCFTLGNHEAEYRYLYNADPSPGKDNNVASWNLIARKRYFPTPVPDAFYDGSRETRAIAGKDELLENYYAWTWGDALFVVLDPFNNTLTNPNSAPADNWRWSLGRTQYDWLKATLQNSRARYKFLFIHHLVGGLESARGGVEAANRYEWGGRNADDTEGFAAKRPGWDMPIHQLLLANRVSAVFHGHDHFYGYQQLDGVVYQECPQPGTANFTTASATEAKYVQGTILPNSGHLRVTVGSDQTQVEYVRAALPSQENATLKNRAIAHTYTIAPAN